MSKKNIDLSNYTVQNNDSTQAKNKYSAFIENEEAETKDTVNTEFLPNSTEKESRVNMAFTDNNYKVITSETSRLGVNFMHFLNYIINSTSEEEIDTFMNDNPLRKGGRNSAPRRRGNPLKRINFKLTTDNHDKLRVLASKNDATITTIVNAILEIYITKNNISTD